MQEYDVNINQIIRDISDCKFNKNKKFSRKIFMYWDAGISFAPDVVYLTWMMARKNNPDYDVIMLDAKSIEGYFPYRQHILSSVTAEIKEAHFADILRTYLLLMHGGVWIDASCFVMAPFSSWLDEIVDDFGYFIGRSDSFSDRRIMNWFLASQSGSAVFSLVLEKLMRFFTKERDVRLDLTFSPEKFCPAELIGPDITDFRAVAEIERHGKFPYFIYHYAWNDVMNENESLRQHFVGMPAIRAPVIKLNRRLFSNVKFFKNRSENLELDRSAVQSNLDLPSAVKDMILTNFG